MPLSGVEKAQGDTGPSTWIAKKEAREPSPVPFESAHLEDLKQLERVSDYIVEKYPERKGQDVDQAFVEILESIIKTSQTRYEDLRKVENELTALRAKYKAERKAVAEGLGTTVDDSLWEQSHHVRRQRDDLYKDVDRLRAFFKEHPPYAVPSDPVGSAILVMNSLKDELGKLKGELREASKVVAESEVDWEKETEKSVLEVSLDKRLSLVEARTGVTETQLSDLLRTLERVEGDHVRILGLIEEITASPKAPDKTPTTSYITDGIPQPAESSQEKELMGAGRWSTDYLSDEFAKVNKKIPDCSPLEREALILRRNAIAAELRTREKPPEPPNPDFTTGFSKVEKEAVAQVQAFLSKMKKGESGLGEGILELQKKLEDFQGVPVPKPCTCGHALAGHEVGDRKNPIPGRCLHESCGCSAYVPGKVEG